LVGCSDLIPYHKSNEGGGNNLSPFLKNRIMPIKKKTEVKDLDTHNELPSNDGSMLFESKEKVEDDVFVQNVVKNVEKEDMLPMSLVQRMVKEVEERLSNQFNKQMEKLKASSSRTYNDDEYIADLEDDWLDQPVVFFAFSFNFAIHGDKKRGEETIPPSGPIRFAPLIRTKRRGQREVQVISVSSVKVQSRAVVEYLRGHSQFGIAFYENMGAAINVDSTWAQKMVEAQQSISRLSDMQMIARAKQEGISITQSPETMRKQLIELQAKRAIDQQNRMLYGSIPTSNIDKSSNRTIVEKTID
jgi:Txe/YoeB family toxin of Txe-Axe toxin-antitoxin module